MGGFWHDLTHGARVLRRDLLYTGVAALALGLGIGATSALFSVVDAALLRKLPFPDPDRLVVVWERNLERGMPYMYAAPPNFADWVSENTAFSGLGAFSTDRHAIAVDGQASALQGADITAGLFGVRPVLGGLAVGLPATLALAQVLRSRLYGAASAHLATYVGVAALLLGISALAAWLPARKATRVDPVIALRSE